MSLWNWNPVLRRYYLTREGAKLLGGRAGQFIGAGVMNGVRDGLVDKSQQRLNDVMQDYIDGRINLQALVLNMRQEVKNLALQQWMLSSGGKNQFTHSEAGKLGNYLRNEYARIQGIAQQVQQGTITPGQAKLYARYQAGYTTSLFERAAANSRGAELPDYPANGNQQCRANCRCSWKWADDGERWLVVWQLSSGAEHCPDCLRNASTWSEANPFVVTKSVLQR